MNKGYYIKARQISESWVAHASPIVREVWDYLIREANHKDTKYNGFVVLRGQLFRSYHDIRDALHWNVGYRKQMYSENQMKHCMKLLRREGMIDLVNQPRGNLITVLQYCKYQDQKIYESTSESTDESTNDQPIINQSPLPINKNDKHVSMKTVNNSESEEKSSPPKTPDIILLHEELLLENDERNERFKGLISDLCDKGYSEVVVEQELHKFVSYWRETNNKGKEKWQGQKFFEVKRRLATWFSNVKQPKQTEWQISTF